jgi:integrase
MTTAPLSLADVVLALQGCNGLSDDRRRDLISAVRRTAALLDAPAEQVPAVLAALRPRLSRILPAAHGIKRKTWHNLRSNFVTAIKATTQSTGVSPPPSPAWARLRRLLPDKRMQNGLTRFLTFCDRAGIQPTDVTDDIADRFVQELVAGTLVADPQDLHRRTCRLWNEAANLPGWPAIHLAVPNYRKPATTIALSALPDSFQDDLRRHLDWLSGGDLLADEPPPTICKPRTIELRRKHLMLAASALIARGHPLDLIARLADLVTLANFKTILRHYLPQQGQPVSVFARGLATGLLAVAQHWVRVPAEQLISLKSLRSRLGETTGGLTEKNVSTMRELADPAVRQRLFSLPRKLINEAQSGGLSRERAATCFQIGLAIEILLHAPIRINNLVSLRLDKNLVRPGGRTGLWHLVLTGAEVKNGEAQEYELAAETTRLLDRYLKQFRPSLDPGQSAFLFVVRGGRPKSQTTLFQQITHAIQTHVGVRMTPHQFRHFAAKLMLEHSPGAFSATSQLLGHRNHKTTVKFYSGIDTLTAGRHFDGILAAERMRTASAGQNTGRGRRPKAGQGRVL